jgi:hypothetical protein
VIGKRLPWSRATLLYSPAIRNCADNGITFQPATTSRLRAAARSSE